MININSEKYAETKVVQLPVRADVSSAMSDYRPDVGWVILSVWCEPLDDERWSNNSIIPLRRTRTCLLLGRTQDLALAEAKVRVDEAESKAKSAREEVSKLALELKRVEDLSSSRQLSVDKLKEEIEEMKRARTFERQRFQAMEIDMGKLRDVLGRKQIDSILSNGV